MSDGLAAGISALAMIIVFVFVVLPALEDATGVVQFSGIFTLGFILMGLAIVVTLLKGR